ncbi:histidinol dehydrogenase [Carnobacterium sp. TMP28]|uniref:histidinol dehydrogenase n=1 Tax=Carnobacterium sp. TMP28 TaxID=3397060 RepID=UPI0039E18521
MIKLIEASKESEKIANILSRSQMDSTEVLETVDHILEEVRIDGDKALVKFTQLYDGNNLENLKVTQEEIEAAKQAIDKDLEKALKNAIKNITAFHKKQVKEGFTINESPAIMLSQMVMPIEKVGLYIPGGTASYPSTVMMNAIPANLAGVKEIVITTPADKNGKIKDSVLVTADLLGVDQIYKIGGAQAIGALCYGSETIPKVDKIVGPGNIYVAMAKHKVSGLVGIDMIAGPSEVLIIADEKANPTFIAADLLAQAEHDKRAASIVVTDSLSQAKAIQKEVEIQLQLLERNEIAREALSEYGAIILCDTKEHCFELANDFAPEHLEILTENPFEDYKKIRNAGAIFLGEYSPEPLGDYYAGPNHTLPTSRTARFSSALSVDDFYKKTSLIYYSKEALRQASEDILLIANNEGLTGHANSIKVRMEEQ